jgi:exodeoxyribonuclease X
MKYIAVDTETTGMDPEKDKLVEIAAVPSKGVHRSTLVNPGVKQIDFGAMAVHHITQDMVKDAPGPLDAIAAVGLADLDKTDTLVFHNAEFDRRFLPSNLLAQPWICTYRCALHLVPNAESHSNGSLWYELGLDHPMPEDAGKMPHRALFDAIMTFDIVSHFIDKHFVESADADPTKLDIGMALAYLISLSTSPVVLSKCNFGKHRGQSWAEIPSDFMRWVLKQDFDFDTRFTCQHWLTERRHG